MVIHPRALVHLLRRSYIKKASVCIEAHEEGEEYLATAQNKHPKLCNMVVCELSCLTYILSLHMTYTGND